MDIYSIVRKLVYCFTIMLLAAGLHAQKWITGQILSTDNESVPFARLGIVQTNVSTLASDSGTFRLLIPEQLNEEELTVQAPGYITSSFAIDTLLSGNFLKLVLENDIRLLEEVTVSKKKYRSKRRVLGNKALPPYGNISYGRQWTLVMLMKVKEPAQIKKLRLRIGGTKSDSVTLRPVLFSYDSLNHLPGKPIITENVFVKAKLQKGWFDYDLSDQMIYVDSPVCLGFEILSTSDPNGDLSVSVSLSERIRNLTWERGTFTFPWRKASNAYLIRAEVEY